MRKTIVVVAMLAMLVASAPSASAKYPKSKIASIKCSSVEEEHTDKHATLVYKVDGKKIIKIAVEHPCQGDELPVIVWWKYKGGTAAVWVDPGTSTDLWKSELSELPVKTKDGKVRFWMDNDDDSYTFNWRAEGDELDGPWPGMYA